MERWRSGRESGWNTGPRVRRRRKAWNRCRHDQEEEDDDDDDDDELTLLLPLLLLLLFLLEEEDEEEEEEGALMSSYRLCVSYRVTAPPPGR
jgi:hypothetical protein